ncbi:hypothetical protein ESY86_17955 [Subsaximicrobium wynnwilliamsii]|uniref:HAMP domain-containing protein n=1 Tax=Subsaximicrobium wynnwilliamsii TaxID=291179 RepID=A0A5C6ZDE2_9FLAO|nr:hypothetical protein [Subsaximicrobium wynnwilliamsii]TXD81533.1 hypothetical protein ESY87_17955 [Subsaximicrobium wynnwilliamsii]TXD87199.1 hypothetical protein ESY86_17955 [Subsaximicrobium wynnwilliamsii]TXE00893.1 hypothetical protein ESY88_18205 [Subsaximicrobium wynnwilliamsii]
MEDDILYRMQIINEMLLEMASGNFYYRIERSENDDNIEALIATLNMLAEEIQETIVHQGYANTEHTTLDIVQMSFILNSKGFIEMVNQKTCNILSALYDDIIGKDFENFLAKASIAKWKATWNLIKEKEIFDTSLDLNFKSKGKLIIPKIAYITTFIDRLSKENKTLVTVVHHSNFKKQLDADLKERVIGSLYIRLVSISCNACYY